MTDQNNTIVFAMLPFKKKIFYFLFNYFLLLNQIKRVDIFDEEFRVYLLQSNSTTFQVKTDNTID